MSIQWPLLGHERAGERHVDVAAGPALCVSDRFRADPERLVRRARSVDDLARGACLRAGLRPGDHAIDVGACPGVRLLATSREPLGCAGEAVVRVPSLALPPAGGAPRRRGARRRPPRCACSSTAPPRGAGVRPDRAERPGRGRGLPAPGRHPPGPGVRRAAGAGAPGRGGRRPAGRPLPAADRRAPHRPGAPADAAGAGGLELRPARPSRAGACSSGSRVFAGAFTLEAAEAVCGGPRGPAGDGGRRPGADVLARLLRLVDTSFVLADADGRAGPRGPGRRRALPPAGDAAGVRPRAPRRRPGRRPRGCATATSRTTSG